MDSHASFAESTDPGEEVEKNADSPRELDGRPEAHRTAIAAVYSSEHSSSDPANGVGGGASFKLRDPGTFGLLTWRQYRKKIRTFFSDASFNEMCKRRWSVLFGLNY